MLIDSKARAAHRREMAFDLGPLHGSFWGTVAANPWRLATAAVGSAVVVAGVGVLFATPVAAVAPAILTLQYAAGAGVAGKGIASWCRPYALALPLYRYFLCVY